MELFYPAEGTYLPHQKPYFDLVKGKSLDLMIAVLEEQVLPWMRAIPEYKRHDAYAAGKWSVQQVILHIHDNDLIFLYRILAVIRGEEGLLPGYDQDRYAESTRDCPSLLQENIRQYGSLRLFVHGFLQTLSPGQLAMTGNINGYRMSVMTMLLLLFGHPLHHCQILKERYML